MALMIGSFKDLSNQYPPTTKKSVPDNQATFNSSSPSKLPDIFLITLSIISVARLDTVLVPIFCQGSSAKYSLPVLLSLSAL